MAEEKDEEGVTLEYTPTWSVALVCTAIVAVSFLVERLLHRAGKYFLKKDQKPLYEALLKIKEELMLLGFISFLLTLSQHSINKICISKDLANTWLPCNQPPPSIITHNLFTSLLIPPSRRHLRPRRRLLLFSREPDEDYCLKKGKAPLMSIKAVHHLHILVFVLAVAHVFFCALTILIGGAKIRQWKAWEQDAVKKEDNRREEEDEEEESSRNIERVVTNVHNHEFIKKRFSGSGKGSILLGWWKSFFKQFYGSVTKSDYITLRFGFIMTHCPRNPMFDFHKYMIRAFEADFKKVVGISWYLWMFVVLFLLLNVTGWHAYFWISFIPAVLLLAVGAKLEHVIMVMAHEVADKHVAIEGDLVVKPSDDHFWFQRPKVVLLLIHVILFQNAFEMAVFFWTWVQYGIDSCIMGKIVYVIPRLVIGAFVQYTCSYGTLPLYALVTQMGSKIKLEAFDQPIQQGLVGWTQKAKRNIGLRKTANGSSSVQVVAGEGSSRTVQMAQMNASDMEEGKLNATH